MNDAQRLTNRAEKARQLDVALRGIAQVRSCLQLLGQLSGELRTQLHVTANIAVALKNLDDDKIREMLEAAGHTSWRCIEVRSREENEARIHQLAAKGGMRFVPIVSESKPN